jgi:hypothetical protein
MEIFFNRPFAHVGFDTAEIHAFFRLCSGDQ